jgi:carboxymethylenebutenolidase
VAQFRDGKLASEHIYWDQASVLVQIGKLDPAGLPIASVEVPGKPWSVEGPGLHFPGVARPSARARQPFPTLYTRKSRCG